MKILHVVGARPNFMKVAPVMAALARRHGVVQVLVHTGQHYDAKMSNVFFHQLGIPEPDFDLEAGSSSHAVQTAEILSALNEVAGQAPVIFPVHPRTRQVMRELGSPIIYKGAAPLEIPARPLLWWDSRHYAARGDLRSQEPGVRRGIQNRL
jgi:hypothetical protein